MSVCLCVVPWNAPTLSQPGYWKEKLDLGVSEIHYLCVLYICTVVVCTVHTYILVVCTVHMYCGCVYCTYVLWLCVLYTCTLVMRAVIQLYL